MIPWPVQEWTIRRLDALAARFGRPTGLPAHLETGLRGEREAFFHLRRAGDIVVARRWTTAKVRGDVDLIVWSGKVLCFVEVKTRTARDAMAAEVAVDRGKREQLRRLANVYLKAFQEPARDRIVVRFDVLSVYLLKTGLLKTGVEFERMESAFGWYEPHGNGSPRSGV
jgi:putative endonuclease